MKERVWVSFSGITEPCSSIDAQTLEHPVAYQHIKNTFTVVLAYESIVTVWIHNVFPSPEIPCLGCLIDL